MVKSPTSSIFIEVNVRVSVLVSMKIVAIPVIIFGCTDSILLIFPSLQFVKESLCAGFGMNDLLSSKVRASGREMARGMLVANTAKVLGAVDLVMPNSFAIAASDDGDVTTTTVDPSLFGLCTFSRSGRKRGRGSRSGGQ